MNNETLKYYIALQPKFREVMGGWQIGDHGYDPIGESICVRFSDTFTRSFCFPSSGMFLLDTSQVIRLPLTIDDSSEEARKRSLSGMIKGGWELLKHPSKDEEYSLMVSPMSISNYDAKEGNNYFEGYSSTECFLKALCAQEGLEVKG